MQCSSCGTENSAQVKFCGECGSRMDIACPYCGFRNPHDATSCGGCRRSLDSALARGPERRQITIFFADIAGSTALAASLDPEDLQEIYAQYQALCAEIVQRYDGHIAQYLGDGVLAYFGYPAAHEDDAARAVQTGLEILQRIGSLSGGVHRLQVRIGIHTGIVVVGDVGAGHHREQLALGEAPNIAARLQSEALPDTMVISEATKKLLAGQFALEDLGARMLKGLPRPMQIFRVIGRSGAASRFQAMKTAQGLTPFVGREREVDSIRAAWEEAAGGNGRTLLLRGEAGMGKSRLLEAAAQVATDRPHEIFHAQCSPYQVNSPLHPIIEMIERCVGIEGDMPAARKLDLIEQFAAGRGVKVEEASSALAGLLSLPTLGRYSEIEIPPTRRPQWTIQVLGQLLVHSVGGSPVLLLIEDLHWADPSTLDLLGEIVAKQASEPVLLVCTTRPGFSVAWLDQPNCKEIRVESLSPEDTRSLVARVAGPKSLPLAVLEEVAIRTAGNPLFVEAVMRTLMEADLLRELEDRYELTRPLPAGLIPASLQDSLMGRIDRLGPDRPVAQLAATIGRESSFELLQTVLEKPNEDLAPALRRLVELDLVSESGVPPASTYTFRHALIQDAAYDSLLRKTRQEFHSKIAEALIHRFPEMAETKPELLARHFEGAGKIAEATAGWMKAGQQAQQRLALRECVAHLQRAISLLGTLTNDDPGRLQSEMEAQLALGQALTATFGWASHESEAAFIRARDLCKELGNKLGLFRAHTGLSGMYFMRGIIPQALETSRPVLDMSRSMGDPLFEIAARHTTSYPAYFLADFILTRELAEGALALYTVERERAIVAMFHIPSSFYCAHILSLTLWFLGYPDQAERMWREAWAMIEALNLPACTTLALGCKLHFHYLSRDHAALARLANQAHTRATDEGYLFWISQARIYRGWAHAVNGDAEAGIAEMKAALESYHLTGTGLLTPQWCLMMAEAQLRAGRAVEALAELCKGIKHAGEYREHVNEPELHRLKGEIHLLQGDTARGEASLRRAIDIAQGQQAKMLELRAANSLAALQHDQGRIAEARDLLEPLHDWFQEGFDTPELQQSRAMLDSLGASTQSSAI